MDQASTDNGPRRSKRVPKPKQFRDFISYLASENDPDDPQTFEEAIQSTHKDEWIKTMKEEHDSRTKNDTWTLVDAPKDEKILTTK